MHWYLPCSPPSSTTLHIFAPARACGQTDACVHTPRFPQQTSMHVDPHQLPSALDLSAFLLAMQQRTRSVKHEPLHALPAARCVPVNPAGHADCWHGLPCMLEAIGHAMRVLGVASATATIMPPPLLPPPPARPPARVAQFCPWRPPCLTANALHKCLARAARVSTQDGAPQ